MEVKETQFHIYKNWVFDSKNFVERSSQKSNRIQPRSKCSMQVTIVKVPFMCNKRLDNSEKHHCWYDNTYGHIYRKISG